MGNMTLKHLLKIKKAIRLFIFFYSRHYLVLKTNITWAKEVNREFPEKEIQMTKLT